MEFHCGNCNKLTTHQSEYFADIEKRHVDKDGHLWDFNLTCNLCGHAGWFDAASIYDSHSCSSEGELCKCDDTVHQHCDTCGGKCNQQPFYG